MWHDKHECTDDDDDGEIPGICKHRMHRMTSEWPISISIGKSVVWSV